MRLVIGALITTAIVLVTILPAQSLRPDPQPGLQQALHDVRRPPVAGHGHKCWCPMCLWKFPRIKKRR